MECAEGVSGDTFFSVFRNFRPHRSHFQMLCALYRSEDATPSKKIRTPENAIKLVCSAILKKVIRQTPVRRHDWEIYTFEKYLKKSMIQKLLLSYIMYCFLSINTSAQNKQNIQIDSTVRNKVLINVCKAIDDFYVFPDKSMLVSKYLQKQNADHKYESKTLPNDLASALTSDILNVINDSHLRIIYDPELEKDILDFSVSKKSANEINKVDLLKEEKQNFYFKKIEVLPGNIGYLEFINFASQNSSARETVRSAMGFLSHTDALIIDLRNNFGGNGTMSNEIGSYFFKKKTYTGRSFNKIENKWHDQYIENRKSITGDLIMEMPIYILTSARTFSAAEGFAYTLQTLKNALIIGDTTRGGAHLTRSFSVGNGFVAFIPICVWKTSKLKQTGKVLELFQISMLKMKNH